MLTLSWFQQPSVTGNSSEKMDSKLAKEKSEEKHSKSSNRHQKRSHHHHQGHEEHHRRFTGTTTCKNHQRNNTVRQQLQLSEPQVHNQNQNQNQNQAGLAAIGAVAAYGALRGSIKIFHHARRAMLRQVLFDLAPALNQGGHSYWLDFGSLLGVHRDGDLILHDNDIDLVVLDPQWDSLHADLSAAPTLSQYNVRLEYPSEAEGATTFLRVYCLLGFADVFGAKQIDDQRLLVDCGHGEMNCISTELVLPTKMIEFKNVQISVPRDLDGACKARYGHTWNIPRYMDKGADTVEANKTYAKIFKALSRVGIRL